MGPLCVDRAADEALVALWDRVAGRFGRVESRRRALAYVRGLLAGAMRPDEPHTPPNKQSPNAQPPNARANGARLAYLAGDRTPDGMQRLLTCYQWSPDAVRDDIREWVGDHIGHQRGVLIPVTIGFPRKGVHAAGVQRQEVRGRVRNCQVGVFLVYAAPGGLAIVDRELYLPPEWTADPGRCERAGVPRAVRFASRSQLGGRMVAGLVAARVPFGWVAADAGFGADPGLRQWLDRSRIPYVLAMPARRAAALAGEQPWSGWYRAAGGPHDAEWSAVDTTPAIAPDPAGQAPPDDGWRRWSLLRRGLTAAHEVAGYHCGGPAGTGVDELAAVAGGNGVGELLAMRRDSVGLDHCRALKWEAWRRHVTLVMLAHAAIATAPAITKCGSGQVRVTNCGVGA